MRVVRESDTESDHLISTRVSSLCPSHRSRACVVPSQVSGGLCSAFLHDLRHFY